MDSEQKQFLSLTVVPARLNARQAAWRLGCQEHDIPILIAAGLLKPLGTPPPNGMKYFATAQLDELHLDMKWLARASDAIHRHWKQKNGTRRSTSEAPLPATRTTA